MTVEISENFIRDIYGLSGIAVNKNYVDSAFSLSGKMWTIIKTNGIKNKGQNIWIYEADEKVFTGVELLEKLIFNTGLERKSILLKKYAYYKHTGPYNLIKQAGQEMISELNKKGFEITSRYIEIYGHWTSVESKLETELFMGLK